MDKFFGVPPERTQLRKIRIGLVMAIRKVVEKRYTHLQAAKKAGVGRTVITAIMSGNLQGMSLDRLTMIALALGIKMELRIAS